MKTVTEQEIQNIMKKAPQFTRDQVVSGLKEKGYTVSDGGGTPSSVQTPPPAASAPTAPTSKPGGIQIGGIGNVLKKAAGIALGPIGTAVLNPRQTMDQASLVAGSTAQLLAKPAVSLYAGVTGDFRPKDIPVAGPVRPYENPLSPASQYVTQAMKKSSPEEVSAAKTIAQHNLGEAAGTTLGTALELGSFGAGGALNKAIKKPLTKVAEKLYQSALKPTEEAIKAGVLKTGLAERVWLTKGGVEAAANKIDDLEAALGKVIDEGQANGAKISTAGLKEFVAPIRGWFETVDVKASKEAQKYIDTTLRNFEKRYGKNIPIEEAQKLKVNTMRLLRNSYGELSNVNRETQKNIARFLKEGIVEKAPEAGQINSRLKNLYALDQSLDKASKRIGNLNLLGLGVKLGAASRGSAGAVVGLVADLMDKAAIKSGAAIGINELSKLSVPGGAIPVTAILNYVLGRGRLPAQSENKQ